MWFKKKVITIVGFAFFQQKNKNNKFLFMFSKTWKLKQKTKTSMISNNLLLLLLLLLLCFECVLTIIIFIIHRGTMMSSQPRVNCSLVFMTWTALIRLEQQWRRVARPGQGHLSLKGGHMYVSIFFIITCVPFLFFMKK